MEMGCKGWQQNWVENVTLKFGGFSECDVNSFMR